jgi:hypothetical protein
VVVGEALGKCAPLVESAGRGEWNFILNNGSMLLVTARSDGDWLHLDAPLGEATAAAAGGGDAWRLLKLNQGLGGLSKLALTRGPQGLRARAEIPLDEDVDLQRRLREACAGLKAAAGRLHGEGKVAAAKASSLSGAQGGEASELRGLCAESGWKFTERAAGKMAVDLETRSGFYQAIVEERGGGAVSAAVEFAAGATFGEESKRAIGALLLRASGVVRMARAVVKEEGEGAGAGFEALFQTRPSAAELCHALSALAVACGLCGQATLAMRDEFVAGNYLAAQGLRAKLK